METHSNGHHATEGSGSGGAHVLESAISQDREIGIPRADVVEERDRVRVLLDMPGVTAGSLSVQVEKNLLAIEGRFEEVAAEGFEPAYREYQIGGYRRTFTISDAVDRDNISATIKDGVVEVVLPKAEELKPRKISVRAV